MSPRDSQCRTHFVAFKRLILKFRCLNRGPIPWNRGIKLNRCGGHYADKEIIRDVKYNSLGIIYKMCIHVYMENEIKAKKWRRSGNEYLSINI